MAVQDDRREAEMCRIAGLKPGENRSGVDAFCDFSEDGIRYSVPIELKSTTNYSVSTARDVGRDHITKWRSRVWIFGFYDPSGIEIRNLLVLGPREMEGWIGLVERYIGPDFAIGDRIFHRLTLEDLHIICGEKDVYSLEDAKSLHKRQWSKDRYFDEMDRENGYSPEKMLRILKLRSRYLINRGATLNNPHIPKKFFFEFRNRMMKLKNESEKPSSSIIAQIRSITIADEKLSRIARNFHS